MKQVIKISQVKNNPNNPRVIKDHDFYVLVNSIKTTPGFMEFRPVIIDYNNMVLCGNQRLRACIYLGHKEIWTDLFTQEKADEMNKEAQKEGRPTKTYLEYCKAITIVDNTHAGTWDWDILANEWEQTELEGWGLDGFPFEDKTLKAEEDNFEVPDEIKTDIVLGDLFEIGEHRLLCGDSTDSDQVAKLMNGQKADMVFTDPPYGMNLNTNYKNEIKDVGRTKRNYNKLIGDNEDFTPELINTIFACFDYCKEIFIWGADYFAELIPNKNEGSWLVWFKSDGVEHCTLGSEFELCWSKTKHKRKVFNIVGKGFFGHNKKLDGDKREHPTQKSVKLIIEMLELYSRDKYLIADLFLGSGSTMVASHQLKRKCYGMELDPKYCQVIIDRMKKLDPNLVIKRNGINIE
jgi:DNA modification methylase